MGADTRIENILNNINLSEEQRATLKRYNEELVISIKDITRYGYLSKLGFLGIFIKKPYEEARKEDIIGFLAMRKRRGDKENTIIGLQLAIKRFYKWLNEGDYPDNVKWIKIKSGITTIQEEHLPTEEEEERMIQAATNSRNKAMIGVLVETGMRVGELCSLTLENAKIKQEQGYPYFILYIQESKTEKRPAYVVRFYSLLAEWIREHPQTKDKKAPLFISLSNQSYGKKIDTNGIRHIIRTIAKRAGIERKVNPHAWRHKKATEIEPIMSTQDMKRLMGWSPTSRMPARYVHTTDKKIEERYLSQYGIKKKEEKKKPILKCHKCGEINHTYALFCRSCKAPLSDEFLKTEEERFLEMFKIPEFRKRFKEMLEELD